MPRGSATARPRLGTALAAAAILAAPLPASVAAGAVPRAVTVPAVPSALGGSIAESGTHGCVLVTGGGVDCWGTGTLGTGAPPPHPPAPPEPVAGVGGAGTLGGIVSVASSELLACGLTGLGNVDCWGVEDNGIGTPTDAPPFELTEVAGVGAVQGVVSLALSGTGGAGEPCFVESTGEVQCGFSGGPPLVGVGGVGTLDDVASIAADSGSFCALLDDGAVDCWSVSPGNFGVPAPEVGVGGVGTLTGITSLSGGGSTFCATTAAGEVVCWGQDPADFSTWDSPTVIPGVGGTGDLGGIVSVAESYDASCAVGSAGAVYCWGANQGGELGDDDAEPASADPVDVLGIGGTGTLGGVTAVSLTDETACATLGDGGVACWGADGDGELGDGGGSGSPFPVALPGVGGTGTLGDAASPTATAVATGVGTAAVAWAPPTSDGGGALSYRVTPTPSCPDCTGLATSGDTFTTIGGLSPSTTYSFTVTATNAAGSSAPSSPTDVVGVQGQWTPTQPLDVTAVHGNGQVTVSWSPPATDGGLPVTGYVAVGGPNALQCTYEVPASGTPADRCTITDLTNGISIVPAVEAENADGFGPAGWDAQAVTPSTIPAVPRGVWATDVQRTATVAWEVPDDNGAPITRFTVRSSANRTVCVTAQASCVVGGLALGAREDFTVVATNLNGNSPRSAPSNDVTPTLWQTATGIPGLAALNDEPSQDAPGATPAALVCQSAGNCETAGTYTGADDVVQVFTAREVGGHWAPAAPLPGLGALNVAVVPGNGATVGGLSCPAPGDCVVAGAYLDASRDSQAYVDTEDDGVWGSATELAGSAALNVGATPDNAGAEVLTVACGGVGSCAIGGYYVDASGEYQAMLASEVAGAWGPAVEAPGTGALNSGATSTNEGAQVTAISCPTPTYCGAVGYVTAQNAGIEAFVTDEVDGAWLDAAQERYDVGGVSTRDFEALAIDCPRPHDCTAGGSFDYGGVGQPIAFSQVAGVWGTAAPVPGVVGLGPEEVAGGAVFEVSCGSATSCVLGGAYAAADGDVEPFLDTDDAGVAGTAFTVPGAVQMNQGGDAEVDALSCGSAGSCSAAGEFTFADGIEGAYVIDEVDGAWGLAQEVPGVAALAYGDSGSLAVSCTAEGGCELAGSYTAGDVEGFVDRLVAVPSAPRRVEVRRVGSRDVVSWSPPLTDGTSRVTRFVVTVIPGGRGCTTAHLSCAIGGPSTDVARRFSVVAVSAAGASSPATTVLRPR